MSNEDPVIVFIDTEFTDIAPGAELLSIGFVAFDTDDELYIELSDADRSGASDFVIEVVFPLFGLHNPEVLTREQAGERINNWFDYLRDSNRDRPIICVSDSAFDWEYLLELYPPMNYGDSWARERNIVGRLLHNMLMSGRQGEAFYEAVEDYFRKHGAEQHHALVDARSLKCGYIDATFTASSRFVP